MEISVFDYDLTCGLAWVIVDNKQLTIQCCLRVDADGNIIEEINAKDCGFDWGSCGDANEKAVELYGKEECLAVLMYEARANGITVINFE